MDACSLNHRPDITYVRVTSLMVWVDNLLRKLQVQTFIKVT